MKNKRMIKEMMKDNKGSKEKQKYDKKRKGTIKNKSIMKK
jgi:hypothetical protein